MRFRFVGPICDSFENTLVLIFFLPLFVFVYFFSCSFVVSWSFCSKEKKFNFYILLCSKQTRNKSQFFCVWTVFDFFKTHIWPFHISTLSHTLCSKALSVLFFPPILSLCCISSGHQFDVRMEVLKPLSSHFKWAKRCWLKKKKNERKREKKQQKHFHLTL